MWLRDRFEERNVRETWGAVAGAVIGGVVSYAGQRSANKQAKKASKGQGEVDTTTTRNPYPGTEEYRNAGMQAAYESLFGHAPGGKDSVGPILGDPNAAPAGGTTGKVPAGYRRNKAGQLVQGKGSKGGQGGGATTAAPAEKPFQGMSQETADIRGRMMTELPKANDPLYGAGQGYIEDTLQGDTRNPLVGSATEAANAISDDPRLAAYQDWLMKDMGIPGAGGASAAAAGGRVKPDTSDPYAVLSSAGPYTVLSSGGGAAQGAGGPAYASSTGVDAALRKLVAGEAPAGWEEMQAGISRKVNEGRAANIRDLRARAVGSGFYGGDVYKDLESGAIAKGDQELADALAAARFGAYQNALGLGTQYDLGMADIGSRDRATSASAGAAAADLASREKLARMGALQDALGLGEQSRFGRAGALGDLAGLVSTDQGRALSGINDITGGRRADLGAAGELSLGSDQARNAFLAARGSERVGLANVGLGRANLAFEKERFYDPFSRLGAYSDILNGMYGGLGSETTTGRDTRSVAPPAYGSTGGAALQGAALGGQIGAAAYKPRNTYSAPQPTNGAYSGSPS